MPTPDIIVPSNEINQLHAERNDLYKQIEMRDLEITQLRQEVDAMQSLLDLLEARAAEEERLHQRLAQRTSELDQARAANDKLKKANDKLKEAIANLKTQRSHLTEALGHCAAAHNLRNQTL